LVKNLYFFFTDNVQYLLTNLRITLGK